MPQERRLFEGQRKYESEVLCPKILRICIKKANISDGILYFRCNLFELSPVIDCWLRMIKMHKKRHSQRKIQRKRSESNLVPYLLEHCSHFFLSIQKCLSAFSWEFCGRSYLFSYQGSFRCSKMLLLSHFFKDVQHFEKEKLWEIKTFLFVKMFTQSAYVSFSF